VTLSLAFVPRDATRQDQVFTAAFIACELASERIWTTRFRRRCERSAAAITFSGKLTDISVETASRRGPSIKLEESRSVTGGFPGLDRPRSSIVGGTVELESHERRT
jgi:hypothetical protein